MKLVLILIAIGRPLVMWFLVAWLAVMVASVGYVFPPLTLAFAHYAAASIYLALVISAPLIIAALALSWCTRRRPTA